VPALTDDSTYVGHFNWSPQWTGRTAHASRLFDYPGKRPLTPTAALALIEQPGARYVLEPCGARENLGAGARATRLPPARLRLHQGLFAR
jgi:hypothetical protein